jgi:hypothetical protein
MVRIYSVSEIIADEVGKLGRRPTREVSDMLDRVQARLAADIERIYRDAVAEGEAYAASTACQGSLVATIGNAYALGTLAAALGHLARGESLGTREPASAPPAATPPEGR